MSVNGMFTETDFFVSPTVLTFSPQGIIKLITHFKNQTLELLFHSRLPIRKLKLS